MNEDLILPELRGYDWKEAFGYAGEPNTNAEENRPEPAMPGLAVPTDPFSREDVKRVIALSEGENDGANWVCVGELKDGRFFSLDAGCDYTGWDCRASGSAAVALTEECIVRMGLTSEQRVRLGLALPDIDANHTRKM